MNSNLFSSIAIGIVLLIGLLNGLRRGGIKEGTALVGVLLGALLVEFWADRWGASLTQRTNMNLNYATWLSALGLLIGTAILAGYGSGLLLRRPALTGGERFAGAALGLLNMALLVSFALRYTQQFYFNEADPTQPVESWIRAGIASRYMLNFLGLVLLGAAIVLALAAVLSTTIRLGRLATNQGASKQPASKPREPAKAPQPVQPRPTTPAAGAAPPQQPKVPAGQQEQFLDRWPPKSGS